AEQTTPLYRWFAKNYSGTLGCEYLSGGTDVGVRRAGGVRNEDLTALTFADRSFDLVVTFDVFEHIPDVMTAFRECRRVLAPGGRLFFSVPFGLNSRRNVIRAVQGQDGSIEHLLPPEYHADPLRAE